MRTSRDTSKYTNQFLKLFEEYRNENVNIRKWLTRFEATFKEVSNLQNSIKKDIDEKAMFGKKGDSKDKEVFDSLSRDLEIMKKSVVKILTQIEKEDPKISEFIGRISHDEISTAGFSFDLIQEYNKEKFLAIQEFVGLMPNFGKDLSGVIELPMVAMSDSAKAFEKFCKELLGVVKRVPSKGAMFESLGILLNYLINYVGNVQTLTQNDKIKFVGFVSSSTSKKIANNFLDSIGSANSIFDEFTKLLTSMNINLSTAHNDGSTYNSLSPDKKAKIDKFTHSTLKVLFKDFTTKSDKDILDIVNNKIYVADLSDVQKEFITKYTALVNSKFTKLVFNTKKTTENLLFICDGLSDYVSFKDFMADKFKGKNKGAVESANVFLTNLINSKDDKEPFKSFIAHNVTEAVLLGADKDSSSGSTDEKLSTSEMDNFNKILTQLKPFDIKSSIDSTSKNEVKQLISELLILMFGDVTKIDSSKFECEQLNKVCNSFSIKDLWETKKLSGELEPLLNFVKSNSSYIKDLDEPMLHKFIELLEKVVPLSL